MIKAKRIIAMSLASAMALTMFGCSNNSSSSDDGGQTNASNPGGESNSNNDPAEPTPGSQAGSTTREIHVGTWFEHYYTSDHDDIYDQPGVEKLDQAQMQLDNMREIEQKYNIRLYYDNLTWDGTISSINLSILAGTPDMDVYEADLQFAVPAVLSDYAQPISSYADKDSDIFTNRVVMKSLQIGSMEESYLFTPNAVNTGAYPLAFNMDLLEAEGLENPQDLYDRGEWTWDVWMDYMKKLTKDTKGDGAIDQYGFCGFWTNLLNQMLLANNTDIAGGTEQHLDKPETVEVIKFIEDMWVTNKVARPWDNDDWNINDYAYRDGNIGFWITATWIADNYENQEDWPFEVGVVPWPRGTSVAEGEDYPGYMTAGNWYFIPTNIENPKLVYDVMFDFTNWYDYDTDLRDDTSWAQTTMFSPKADDPTRNYSYLVKMGETEAVDFWGSIKDGDWGISLQPIITGEITSAQYIEENKAKLQEAMDNYFK